MTSMISHCTNLFQRVGQGEQDCASKQQHESILGHGIRGACQDATVALLLLNICSPIIYQVTVADTSTSLRLL